VIRLVSRRIRSLPALLAAGALALSSVPLSAQEIDPLAKLDQTSRFAVEAMIDSAYAAGLPGGALRSRALEGLQKKAPTSKIVGAVRTLFGNLKTSRSTLGAVADEELLAAAAVLEAGGKPTQLSAFRERKKGRSDLQAFTVWADLISRGVSLDDASTAITKLWQDGADDMTFRRLWNDVQSDISSGLKPGDALLNRIRESPTRPPQKSTPEE